MNLMYSRQKKKHLTKRLTDAAWKYIKEVQEKGRRDTVSSSTQNVTLIRPFERFTVLAPQGTSHIVNLIDKSCTCLHFQDQKLPCRHATQVCREHNLEIEDYVSPIYTIETYRSLYSDNHAMPPIRVQDISISDYSLAPQIQKKKDRPQKKRLRREALKRGKRLQHCGVCRSTDHDRRCCDYSGPSISSRLTRDQNNQSSSESKSSESDNTTSEFLDWNGFSESDWNGFSDSEDIPEIGLDPGNNSLHLITNWQGSNHSDNSSLNLHNSSVVCPNPGLPLPRPMLPMIIDQQSQISTPAVNQPSEIYDTPATRPPTHNDDDDSSSLLTSLGSEDGNETDSVIRQEQIPTPESVYSEGEKRLIERCARFVHTEDPSYTKALEGYRLFPDRPEFKLMVERRNHQRYYETEEWALSALNQRRNIFQLCQHRLTPEQITKIEGEIYPHRARKPLSAKRLELLKNVPLFSIMTPQTSDPISDEEIIKPMVEEQKKKLAAFLEKSKSKTKDHVPTLTIPVEGVFLYPIHLYFYDLLRCSMSEMR